MKNKNKIQKKELVEFIGTFTLTGFDRYVVPKVEKYDGDSAVALFILDNVTYAIVEDPEDGYRSSMKDLFVTKEICKNKIPPHIVEGKKKPNGYGKNDVIDFYDVFTNKIVLSIGTSDCDDYYPCCQMLFTPEHLAVNDMPEMYNKWLRESKLNRILKD